MDHRASNTQRLQAEDAFPLRTCGMDDGTAVRGQQGLFQEINQINPKADCKNPFSKKGLAATMQPLKALTRGRRSRREQIPTSPAVFQQPHPRCSARPSPRAPGTPTAPKRSQSAPAKMGPRR